MADDAALIERRKMAIEQFEGTVEEQLVKMSAAEIDGNSAAEDAARSAGLSAAECVNQLKAMTPQEFKTWEQAKRPKYELEVKKVHGLRVELQKLTVERDQMELEKASDVAVHSDDNYSYRRNGRRQTPPKIVSISALIFS